MLVWRMRLVVWQRESQQNDWDPEQPTNHPGRWNGPARGQEGWFRAEPLQAGGRDGVRTWVSWVEEVRRHTAAGPDLRSNGRGRDLGQMAPKQPLHVGRVLVGHE